MTKNVSVGLIVEPDNNRVSTLEGLAGICHPSEHLSVDDIDNFAAVISSPHPEELLIGSPLGSVDEREGTLSSRALIRWQLNEMNRASTLETLVS
ncbi:hypothetical protein GN244_ATG02292 [Phytophthora infestans]|uniref:Uncharacterized protein n=1 Tax=Phytophthora infestans TaxID=4787 RepID=A0A833X1E8_PHYIN|nr:hypothetical protein GN244_ATG02292 [Phytophthora infestans]KAF4148189.1 hypothetical protein GN958_ATG02613 [Phytophthora infestans]